VKFTEIPVLLFYHLFNH